MLLWLWEGASSYKESMVPRINIKMEKEMLDDIK